MSKWETSLVFIITDWFGVVCGVAPTKTQALKQINWFLPKGMNYKIQMFVFHSNSEDDSTIVYGT